VFHPTEKWAYSINELNSTITFLHWDAATGGLRIVADVPTLPAEGDIAKNRAGELAFDRTGRYLYACNRGGAEELLTFSVGKDGRLRLLGRLQTAGKEARHFLVSPDGGYVVVAEQFSNEVAVFARNRQTGLLTASDARYPMESPSCVVFCGMGI
jgi:6-phosphogluconolactonase